MIHFKKKYILILMIAVLGTLFVTAGYPTPPAAKASKLDQRVLRTRMQQLWEDHNTWLHIFIVGELGNQQYRDPAKKRVQSIQSEIAASIQPFYGQEASDRFLELLDLHLELCEKLLKAAKRADADEFQEVVTLWYDNADNMAAFLNELNPEDWPLGQTRLTLRTYLNLTLEGAMARWKRDYSSSQAAFDRSETQTDQIAQMLSDGIINQFQRQFK